MAEQVVLGWQLSTAHGWGVYGLNLALNWASDPQIESATSRVPHIIDIDLLPAAISVRRTEDDNSRPAPMTATEAVTF